MAGFYRTLTEILIAHGCYLERPGRGDHEIWFSPINQRRFTVDRGTKSRHTANESLKQAGIDRKI